MLLIGANHRDVWEYSYEDFETACKALEIQQRQQTLSMSLAIGLALSEDGFEDYQKETDEKWRKLLE